jgi:phosphorylcholine metabolism protein LicD
MNLFFIIVCILFCWFFIKLYFNESTSALKNDNENNNKIMYGLKIMHQIFEKHNIYYTIAYGTLLGAVRHRNMIPWDDDADINVMRSDYDLIIKLSDEFRSYGLIIEADWKLIKIYFDSSRYPFIDIFVNDIVDNKIVRCAQPFNKTCVELDNTNATNWWHKWIHYPAEWIINKKIYYFGSLQLWGPSEPDKLLKYWYGPNYLTECQTAELDHLTGQLAKPTIINCGKLPKPQL